MFSIIALIYDPFDLFVPAGAIQATLEKVFSLEGNYELIVVNNNPITLCPLLTQYLTALRDSHPGKMKIVAPNANLGTARGFNAGVNAARANSQFFVFLSSDADIVDKGMLNKIQQALDNNLRVGIAHPYSVYEDNDEYNFSKYNRKAFHRMIHQRVSPESAEISDIELERILGSISGRKGIEAPLPSMPLTFAVITRKLIEKIGPFDEGVQMCCHENNDLAYRALLGGFTVARLNNVFVNHRRFLFHSLTVSSARQSGAMPHLEAIKQSSAWWNKKWGKPYNELYTRWRWGLFVYTSMLPYFWLRRLAASLRARFHTITDMRQSLFTRKRTKSV